MTGAGVRRRMLSAALVAVLLVIVQFFAHGADEGASAVESRTPPATAMYSQCGGDTHSEESERFPARGRPHCRDLTPDTAPQLHAHPATTADDGTRACRAIAVARPGTKPAGRELPALLQVFRC